jgi:hypothetical protein
MTRKLKTLGLALLTALAASASMASVAIATSDVFHSENQKAVLTGTQEGANRFTYTGQWIECNTAKLKATMTETEVSAISTLEPTYENCSPLTISTNGCKYNFTGSTDASGDARVDVVDCAPGKSLAFNGFGCIFTVQSVDEGNTYTNVGTGTTRSILVHLTERFLVKSDPNPTEGIFCAAATNTTPFFTLEGTMMLTGEEEGGSGHVGVWVE